VLVGPTASGKTSLAIRVAERRIDRGLPTEVVSCDSMAVYRGMDVGTATPTPEERAGVPHHLLDVVDPWEEFSVQRFVELADDALDDVESRGASALLVGGTGLYVQAVTDALDLPGRYPETVAALEPLSTDELTARLIELDPVAADRVPPGNRRRLLRALEVTIGSGRRFSESGPGLTAFPSTPFVLTGLAVPRDVLRARIGARYRRQVADGLVDEVRALVEEPRGISRTAAEALGYRELLAHLRGEVAMDEALSVAEQRTGRFAVRQERWFRRDPRIEWFAAGGDVDVAELAGRVDDHWRQATAAAGLVDPDDGDAPTTVGPSCCD
jgi:tRNA dimethylallyltransferase